MNIPKLTDFKHFPQEFRFRYVTEGPSRFRIGKNSPAPSCRAVNVPSENGVVPVFALFHKTNNNQFAESRGVYFQHQANHSAHPISSGGGDAGAVSVTSNSSNAAGNGSIAPGDFSISPFEVGSHAGYLVYNKKVTDNQCMTTESQSFEITFDNLYLVKEKGGKKKGAEPDVYLRYNFLQESNGAFALLNKDWFDVCKIHSTRSSENPKPVIEQMWPNKLRSDFEQVLLLFEKPLSKKENLKIFVRNGNKEQELKEDFEYTSQIAASFRPELSKYRDPESHSSEFKFRISHHLASSKETVFSDYKTIIFVDSGIQKRKNSCTNNDISSAKRPYKEILQQRFGAGTSVFAEKEAPLTECESLIDDMKDMPPSELVDYIVNSDTGDKQNCIDDYTSSGKLNQLGHIFAKHGQTDETMRHVFQCIPKALLVLNDLGDTALQMAIGKENLQQAKILLESMITTEEGRECLNNQDSDEHTALMLLMHVEGEEVEWCELLNVLLANGAKLGLQDKLERNVFHHCVNQKKLTFFKCLLKEAQKRNELHLVTKADITELSVIQMCIFSHDHVATDFLRLALHYNTYNPGHCVKSTGENIFHLAVAYDKRQHFNTILDHYATMRDATMQLVSLLNAETRSKETVLDLILAPNRAEWQRADCDLELSLRRLGGLNRLDKPEYRMGEHPFSDIMENFDDNGVDCDDVMMNSWVTIPIQEDRTNNAMMTGVSINSFLQSNGVLIGHNNSLDIMEHIRRKNLNIHSLRSLGQELVSSAEYSHAITSSQCVNKCYQAIEEGLRRELTVEDVDRILMRLHVNEVM